VSSHKRVECLTVVTLPVCISRNLVILANCTLDVGVYRYHNDKHRSGKRGMIERELAQFKVTIATVTARAICRNIKTPCVLPTEHTICVRFVWLPEQTATFS
jgi:hypothetical protein